MHHLGIDVHKKTCQIQHMDEGGYLGYTEIIPTEKSELFKFFDKLDQPVSVTFEAGRNYWSFLNMIKSHQKISRIKVVDPRRSRNIAKELSMITGYGRAKNDRIDAEMLADQDRRNLAPAIHIPTQKEFEERTLMRHRIDMMQLQTKILNKIHSLLVMHGKDLSKKDILNHESSLQTELDKIPSNIKFVCLNYCSLLRSINTQIIELERTIIDILPDSNPDIRLLLAVPGFGKILSRLVYAEIYDISRFKEHKNLMSYCGLAPIIHESAGKKGHVKLNPYSNRYLKYAFIIAAHHARTHVKFKQKYNSDKKKHGAMRAKTNLARRLVKIVFSMLTRQQIFQEH